MHRHLVACSALLIGASFFSRVRGLGHGLFGTLLAPLLIGNRHCDPPRTGWRSTWQAGEHVPSLRVRAPSPETVRSCSAAIWQWSSPNPERASTTSKFPSSTRPRLVFTKLQAGDVVGTAYVPRLHCRIWLAALRLSLRQRHRAQARCAGVTVKGDRKGTLASSRGGRMMSTSARSPASPRSRSRSVGSLVARQTAAIPRASDYHSLLVSSSEPNTLLLGRTPEFTDH